MIQPLIRTKIWVQALLIVFLSISGIGPRAQVPQKTDDLLRDSNGFIELGCQGVFSVYEKGMTQQQTFDRAATYLKAKDFDSACSGFHRLAKEGHTAAQYQVGVMYQYGQGVRQDGKEAERLFHLAAKKGNADAQAKLGTRYLLGEPKNAKEAARFFQMSAEQGHANAALNLAAMYDTGNGLSLNQAQAVKWYRVAAEQGNLLAQQQLAANLAQGQGTPVDFQMAYFWLIVVREGNLIDVIRIRKLVGERLTSEQRTAVQTLASNWRPKSATQALAMSEQPNPKTNWNAGPDSSNQPASTGSGFRIASNTIVTNHHVIDSCTRLRVNGVAAQVRGSDARSDLALLNVASTGPSTNLRAQRAAVGEPVSVAGYPLRGLLSGFNMTTGNLSSLSGMGGDTRLVQITAPVQPGNSGGPVLDSSGNLMAVVVSKLDAVKAAKLTGDIPQNVNFAINGNVLRSFLDANSVDYETASSDKVLATTAIAEKAKNFTVLIECWR